MIPFPRPTLLLAGLLLLVLFAVLLSHLLLAPRGAVVTYYVSQLDGSDSVSCSDAQSASRPKRTLNAGIGCLAGGNHLEIAPGLYQEWLVTQMNSAGTVEQRYLDVQPGTRIIPNGTSGQPTVLRAGPGGKVVLSPTTKNPETGVILGAIGAYARWITVEGLHFDKAGGRDERTQAGGIYLADSQDMIIRGGGVYRGTVKSSIGSQRLTFEGMEVSYSGEGCNFEEGDPATGGQPCPHGYYACGTNHVIRSNYIHSFSHTGIQVSCEQGSSTAMIQGNRIVNGPGPGISLKGGGTVTANVIEGCGVGIRVYGGVVAENTINDYYRNNDWVPDPFGIVVNGGAQVFGNLIYKQKSAWNLITHQQFAPIDTTAVHTNMCDVAGNVGCTMVHAPETVFTDYAARDYTLKESAPARRAGQAHAAITVDIRRQPYGTPPDLGAHTYGTAPPQADITPPTVRVSNPPNNEQVFGPSLPLAATASDNVAVVSVTFQVDGVTLGAPLTSVPYQMTWDTTTVANGPHSIAAVARDAAGNQATATITVRVENATPPTPVPVVLSCNGTITGSTFALACTQPVEGRQ